MDSTGATERATPPKVCATPMVTPSSRRSTRPESIDVVDGNSRAVPMGTSGITRIASSQRLPTMGYSRNPTISATQPIRTVDRSPNRSTTGPRSTTRITSERMPK